MSNTSTIKIISTEDNQILYEYSLELADLAYQQAAELEEMGLDITVIHPNVTETLCQSLGLNLEQQQDYHQSVVAEIEDHDGSCCHNGHTPHG